MSSHFRYLSEAELSISAKAMLFNIHSLEPHVDIVTHEMDFLGKAGTFLTGYTAQYLSMCFKKSFTTLRAYTNLFRGHVQCFERS
jgi:hypothetical protein